MTTIFTSGWITCMDESMSICTNKWTSPDCIFCPMKPHLIGNKYNSIYCGLYDKLFTIDLPEGNTRPKELPSDLRTKKTTNLIFCLCNLLYSAGKLIMLDRYFCVLEGMIELRKVDVFEGALIKTLCY